MKKKWSPEWKSSKQPRKQRKYRHNAPMHVKHKFVSVNLSPILRKRYEKRSMPVRKGDEIKVMRGSFKGKKGKIDRISLKKCKVYIEDIKMKKVDGSEILRPFQPSNLMITALNIDDKKRKAVLERKMQKKEVKK